MIADGIAIARDLDLHPGTLRNWATAGRLQRRGRDRAGRTLYDYDDVKQLAIAAGIHQEEENLHEEIASSCQRALRTDHRAHCGRNTGRRDQRLLR